MMDLGRILSEFILHTKLHSIYLKGDLGSGKTSFVRSILNGLGVYETVSSPSFSIIEIYNNNDREIIHIDMFRIQCPEAWRTDEIRNYLEDCENLILLEWPDKANLLPEPNLMIEFFWSNELNPDGPRDIKISGTEISKFSSYIDSQDLKT
jgi:tRNA threonylcarbamoyladenosine biosynthesis protein TsaE